MVCVYIIFKFNECLQIVFLTNIQNMCKLKQSQVSKAIVNICTYKILLVFIPEMKYACLAYKDPTWGDFYLSQTKKCRQGTCSIQQPTFLFGLRVYLSVGSHYKTVQIYDMSAMIHTYLQKFKSYKFSVSSKKVTKIEWNNQHTEYITTLSQVSSFPSRKSKTKSCGLASKICD